MKYIPFVVARLKSKVTVKIGLSVQSSVDSMIGYFVSVIWTLTQENLTVRSTMLYASET